MKGHSVSLNRRTNIEKESNMKSVWKTELPQFIGVKIVSAEPMTREAFEAKHGRNVGGDKHGEGYEVTYEGGYQAWSPKDVFDAACRPTDGMTFGLAVEALKLGKKVARRGWNGKGLWVRRVDLYSDKEFRVREEPGAVGTFMPFYVIYNPGDGKLNTWVASITDTQAEDWVVVG